MNRKKQRYARRLDSARSFKPKGIPTRNLETTFLALDELEALRLSDYEGLSQIQAAEEMKVSRATVQRLLQSGRKKIVDVILHNKALEMRNDISNIRLKGENKMNVEKKQRKIIAFPTTDQTTVDEHFGHTAQFALYTIDNNEIVACNYVTPPPHEPGVLPRFLGEQDVDVIITGGMGQMAVRLFKQQNIDVVLGARGPIKANLEDYVGGTLESKGSACDHNHGEHH